MLAIALEYNLSKTFISYGMNMATVYAEILPQNK